MHSTFSLAVLETIIFMFCELHFWPTPPHSSLLLHLSHTGLIFLSPSLSLSAHLHQYIYSFNWNTDKKIYCSEQTEEFHFEEGLVVCLQGTKALAVPLVTNTSILRLNLRDNWMEGMGGAAIAEMLKENCYITGGFTGHSSVHMFSLPFPLLCLTFF